MSGSILNLGVERGHMVATVALLFLSILVFYFSLIIYCNFEVSNNLTTPATNTSVISSPQQLCVDHYVDSLIERALPKLLSQPIDILVYCANLVSTNILQILVCLCLSMSIYGWVTNAEEMKRCVQDLYHEIKHTTRAVLQEFRTVGEAAIVAVWTSLSIIKAVQFAFLLLLLIAVPDFIDYLKKALIRFAKLA